MKIYASKQPTLDTFVGRDVWVKANIMTDEGFPISVLHEHYWIRVISKRYLDSGEQVYKINRFSDWDLDNENHYDGCVPYDWALNSTEEYLERYIKLVKPIEALPTSEIFEE